MLSRWTQFFIHLLGLRNVCFCQNIGLRALNIDLVPVHLTFSPVQSMLELMKQLLGLRQIRKFTKSNSISFMSDIALFSSQKFFVL